MAEPGTYQRNGRRNAGTTEAVFHALLRTWGKLRQVQEPYFARFGVSGAQWGILRVLQRAEHAGETALPLNTVAQRMLIQPPSVTGVVDRLERLGLVKRSPSKQDARVRHLSLTPRGRKLVDRVLVGHGDRIASLFAEHSPEELEAMQGMLKRLEARLTLLASQELGTEATPPKSNKDKLPK